MGPEFQVNSYTTGNQSLPRVSANDDGNFVVVWESPLENNVTAIHARRYDAAGVALTGEFLVAQDTGVAQMNSAVDQDLAGNFVVTWLRETLDTAERDIMGRAFDASGAPLGAAFRVNTYTTSSQVRSSVALGSHGDAVVVWASVGQDAPVTEGVFGQRYSDLIFADGFDPAGP